jgi:hypothetical protein
VDDRASWYYNHRGDIDEQRYKDALAKDAQMEARIRELEAKNAPRDSNYVPAGLDPDLQYDESYCDGVYNPQDGSDSGFLHGLWVVVKWIFGIILTVVVLAILWWFIFKYRWL